MSLSEKLTSVPFENHNRQTLLQCLQCQGVGSKTSATKGGKRLEIRKAAVGVYRRNGYEVVDARCPICKGAGLVVKG